MTISLVALTGVAAFSVLSPALPPETSPPQQVYPQAYMLISASNFQYWRNI
jgi:hypothetical protein